MTSKIDENEMPETRKRWIQAALQGNIVELSETYGSVRTILAISVNELDRKKLVRIASRILDTVFAIGQQSVDLDFLKALMELSKNSSASRYIS